MTEDLKGLIEKIQEEGVKAAEEKARSIEEEAEKKAQQIADKARRDAENIIRETQEEVARIQKSGEDSLRNAARDVVLSLRKEINSVLDRVIISRVQEALTPEELARILTFTIKSYKDKKDITVSLAKNDLERIEKPLFKDLKDELREGVTLKASEDIRGGFIISYDKGKSYYDYTDKALAEHIGLYLKPKLKALLAGSVEG